jgi:hypothetical protein
MMEKSTVFLKIRQHLRVGERDHARKLLIAIIKQDPHSDEAWYLISFAVETHAHRVDALRRAVGYNPENHVARKRLLEISTKRRQNAISQQEADHTGDEARDHATKPGIASTAGQAALQTIPTQSTPINEEHNQILRRRLLEGNHARKSRKTQIWHWTAAIVLGTVIIMMSIDGVLSQGFLDDVKVRLGWLESQNTISSTESLASARIEITLPSEPVEKENVAGALPTPARFNNSIQSQPLLRSDSFALEDTLLDQEEGRLARTTQFNVEPNPFDSNELSMQASKLPTKDEFDVDGDEISRSDDSDLATPQESAAETEVESALTFDSFVAQVKNGDKDQVVGVYVEQVLALKVIQQPASNPGFVSERNGETTYFYLVYEVYKNDGLIAHNYLSGGLFFQLNPGQTATIIYGDGSLRDFEIRRIQRYQALSPNSPYSDFLNLNTDELLNATNLFNLIYGGELKLTFQTCIERDGEPSWGRIFITGDEL